MNNEERAMQVAPAIEKFAKATGLVISDDGPATAGGDFISGVLHWVALQSGDPKEAIQAAMSGLSHFLSENYGVDEEFSDLDFHVDMTATAAQAGVEVSYETGAGGPVIDIDEEVNDAFRQQIEGSMKP